MCFVLFLGIIIHTFERSDGTVFQTNLLFLYLAL